MAGGNFTALDISGMYDDTLLDELRELANAQEVVIGFDGDDIDLLISLEDTNSENDTPEDGKTVGKDKPAKNEQECPNCGHQY